MKIATYKIVLFLLGVLGMGILVFPHQGMMGVVYQGMGQYPLAEKSFLKFLEKKPHHREFNLRLAALYERLAQPEKSLTVIRILLDHRKQDWDLAKIYLEKLEEAHHDQALFEARIQLVDQFEPLQSVPRQELIVQLEDALAYAKWKQLSQQAYQILLTLIRISPRPQIYEEDLYAMDLGYKNTQSAMIYLQKKLQKNSEDDAARDELFGLLLIIKNITEAKHLLQEQLSKHPDSLLWLQRQMEMAVSETNYTLAKSSIIKILDNPNLDVSKKYYFQKELVYFYEQLHEYEQALSLVSQLLLANPNDAALLRQQYDLASRTGNKSLALTLLENYVRHFPEDMQMRKELAYFYLYVRKDLQKLPFYLAYYLASHDGNFARDIAYSLVDHKNYALALAWLGMAGLHGLQDNLLLATIYFELKQDDKVIAILQDIKTKDAYQLLAQVYERKKNWQQTFYYYEQLLPNIKASEQPDYFYRLAQLALSLKDVAKTQYYTKKLFHYFDTYHPDTAEWLRYYLWAKSHLIKSKTIVKEYRDALQKYPKDRELNMEYIGLLIEQQLWQEANLQLNLWEPQNQEEKALHFYYQAQIYLGRMQPKLALEYCLKAMQLSPQSVEMNYLLADANIILHRYHQALSSLELLQRSPWADPSLKGRILDLHDIIDAKASLGFHYNHVGGSDVFSWPLRYEKQQNEKLRLELSSETGFYQLSSPALRSAFSENKMTAKYQLHDYWQLYANLGFSQSELRNSPSLGLGFVFEHPKNFRLSMDAGYRNMVHDTAQELNVGELRDEVNVAASYTLQDRYIFGLGYQAQRNYLPNGDELWIQQLDPSLTWRILTKPSLNVGYRYAYRHGDDQAPFLNQLGLITQTSSHYLSANVSHEWQDKILVEAGVFAGEDTKRDLHLFEGDLYGVNAGIRYRMLKNIDIKLNYDFSRETLNSIAGSGHDVQVYLTGHW